MSYQEPNQTIAKTIIFLQIHIYVFVSVFWYICLFIVCEYTYNERMYMIIYELYWVPGQFSIVCEI